MLHKDDAELTELISTGITAYRKWNFSSQVELPTFDIWSKYVFNNIAIDLAALRSISEELSFFIRNEILYP